MHGSRAGLVTATALLLSVAAPPVSYSVWAAPTPQERSPGDGSAKASTLAPGVRIDWSTPAVEVDAKVVLRSGPLELFVCARGTREHESILAVDVSPTHIYQAMGLIGLEPGSPVQYDEKRKTFVPPTGEPLELFVRYGKANKERTVPAHTWMRSCEKGGKATTVRWVFAGSRLTDERKLAAEADGTIACVVDFSTALIAVDALHTSANANLWLCANTPDIPAIGTACTLVIRSARVRFVDVDITSDGAFQAAGKPIAPAALAATYRRKEADTRPVVWRLHPASDTPSALIEAAVKSLVDHGIVRESIQVSARPRRAQDGNSGAAGAGGG